MDKQAIKIKAEKELISLQRKFEYIQRNPSLCKSGSKTNPMGSAEEFHCFERYLKRLKEDKDIGEKLTYAIVAALMRKALKEYDLYKEVFDDLKKSGELLLALNVGIKYNKKPKSYAEKNQIPLDISGE